MRVRPEDVWAALSLLSLSWSQILADTNHIADPGVLPENAGAFRADLSPPETNKTWRQAAKLAASSKSNESETKSKTSEQNRSLSDSEKVRQADVVQSDKGRGPQNGHRTVNTSAVVGASVARGAIDSVSVPRPASGEPPKVGDAIRGGSPSRPATSLLASAADRLQRMLAAIQPVADAFMEVPRQLWLLPIRFGFYPGLQRTQEEIPGLVRFPCRQNRTSPPPTSVHRLRPGDVRVVAALGDSLTAANGAMAYSEDETRLNYRGVSAMGGGQGNWRKYLTLPNILKEFNPKLLGYALGTVESNSPIAGLNVAENGALDDELLGQAKLLVSKLRRDPFIDVDHDWKLVNILIGGNDLCNEFCYVDGGKDSPEGHRAALEVALDFLQRNLPRTFVNLIHIPNIIVLSNMKNVPFVCYLKQLVLCSCLFGGAERAKAESVSRMLHGYWNAERRLAEDPRYDTENFTVVLQPFFLGVDSPDDVNTWFGEAPDLSYFAPDCFHFSQKGNALVANALWNNMLEPVGEKTFGWQPLMERFLCPTENSPFLFTRRNSKTFLETGHQ